MDEAGLQLLSYTVYLQLKEDTGVKHEGRRVDEPYDGVALEALSGRLRGAGGRVGVGRSGERTTVSRIAARLLAPR